MEVLEMNKITIATLLSAGMVTLAACDSASNDVAGVEEPQVSFEAADANGDGRITTQEGLAVPGLQFDRMDSDKNMAVTREEYATAMALARPRG
jgi:hypothetical protein